MKTDKKTVGFGGGFTDAGTVRPRCRATAVLPRSLARDVVMKAEVYRDNAGFWMARIEEDASTPENRGIGRVYRRQMLPVAPSASKAEAEAALRRVMSREARCPRHGHR